MAPRIMGRTGRLDMNHGPPFRAFGFSQEADTSLLRGAIALAAIAVDARTNDVLPSRLAALMAWHHMIDVQILPFESQTAILAGELVALEDIIAGELDLLLRQPIEHQEQNDLGNANLEGDGMNDIVAAVAAGKVKPLVKIHRQERSRGSVDYLGVPLVKQRKGATDRTNIHRLPQAIEYQHVLTQGFHGK